MATQLIVRYGHLGHRFVKLTTVKLELKGTPEPEQKASKLGTHIFTIAPGFVGSVLTLTIEIPVPAVLIDAGITSPPLMSITQILEVVRTSAGLVTLRPHPTSPGNRFVGGFHPRLSGQSVNSAAGHIFYIDVDNTFLKVNRIAGAANPGFVRPYLAATTPFLPGVAPHYDCRLTLYEYTGGKPNLWPVLVPPAVKVDTKTVHALLFFRPASAHQYKSLEDANSGSLMRYLLDPDPAAPFFVDTRRPTTAKIEIISNCGFERSISSANKPLIFVSPLPHGSDYGHAGTALWPDLLKSLITALWAESDIGQSVSQGLLLGRTAAGGFSFGGLTVFSMLAAALSLPSPGPGKPQPDPLHELYLFDCREFTDVDQANVKRWFAKGGKKLRMVGGGLFHAKMLALAAQMNASDASVIPSGADDWLTDNLYRAGVSFHKFDPSSAIGPTTGSVSDFTGLFLVGPGAPKGTVLEGRDRSSGTVGTQTVANFGSEELTAAAMLYNDSFRALPRPNGLDKEFAKHKPPETPPPVPLDSKANFPRLLTALEGRCKAIRHQWSVVGGRDSAAKTDRVATFKGFLQICIELGDFP
jgi:hypothetical protein